MERFKTKTIKRLAKIFTACLTLALIGYAAWQFSPRNTDRTVNPPPTTAPLARAAASDTNVPNKLHKECSGPTIARFRSNLMLDGEAELLVIADDGRKVGFEGDRYFEEMAIMKVPNEQGYMAFPDVGLTAQVTGTKQGSYALSKLWGDGFVKLTGVPSGKKLSDTIKFGENCLTITFGEGASRMGAYNLYVEKGATYPSIFDAKSLPVIPGATFQLRFDWESLRAGKDGVTIKIDLDKDGKADFSGIVGRKVVCSGYFGSGVVNASSEALRCLRGNIE